jgi:anti-sigma28 factor (negative regulator of flagellin synthesis)
MEIRNDAEALKAFLGVSSTTSAETHPIRNTDTAAAQAAFAGDLATFSQAATEVSQSAAQSGVRAEKVAAIQQALAARTYDVPASAVAGKVIDAMLGGGIGRGNRG